MIGTQIRSRSARQPVDLLPFREVMRRGRTSGGARNRRCTGSLPAAIRSIAGRLSLYRGSSRPELQPVTPGRAPCLTLQAPGAMYCSSEHCAPGSAEPAAMGPGYPGPMFLSWCAERGLRALPACTETIAGFVDAIAATLAPATVRCDVASMALAQRSSPTQGPGSDLPACPDPRPSKCRIYDRVPLPRVDQRSGRHMPCRDPHIRAFRSSR